MSIRIQGRPFNITVIQVYAPSTSAEETEIDQFYEDFKHFLELTPKKDEEISTTSDMQMVPL